MTVSNDFLPFGTAGGAAVLTNAAYAGIYSGAGPAAGFPAGILPKEYLNKALRQGAVMAAAVAGVINAGGQNALDDGNLPTLTNNLILALKALLLPHDGFFGAGKQLLTVDGGYQTLPGGLILQWVKGTAKTDQTSETVTFPVSFTTAVMGCQVSTINPAIGIALNGQTFLEISHNLAGCTVFCQASITSWTAPIYPMVWALGY